LHRQEVLHGRSRIKKNITAKKIFVSNRRNLGAVT